MAVEKREQVFISSTFQDLFEERQAVIQTLLEADCIPSGMELFPASDDEKWNLIQRVIDLCDYYVVIVGGRYGSVDVKEQLSYTEMEFDYAVREGKPVMGFLHGDPGKIIGDKLDFDPELRDKLDMFRSKIEQRMVKYWHKPEDLRGQVALSIIQIRKSHPAEGWIRAGEAMTPEVKQELSELRAKVAQLTAELKDAERQRAGFELTDLEQGDDTIRLEYVIDYHSQETINANTARVSNQRRAWDEADTTWNFIFSRLGPEMMDEAAESHLLDSLNDLCLGLARENNEYRKKNEKLGRIYSAAVDQSSFNDVKVQLVALGYIEPGTKRRPPSDINTYWKLSPRGHEQLLRLRALRKSADIEGAEDH